MALANVENEAENSTEHNLEQMMESDGTMVLRHML